MESEPRPPSPKPYLRRGSGWESRVQAAREGRRYRPKGGPVLNYAEPSSAQPHRSPAKAAPIRLKATSKQATGAQASKRPPSDKQREAAGPPQPVPRAAAAASRQPRQDWSKKLLASAPPKQHTTARARPHAELAGTGLPQGSSAALAAPTAWHGHEEEEELALKEFCALESEVLREVSNTPQGGSLGPADPAARPPQLRFANSIPSWPEANQCSAASNWPQPESEEEDTFQSDGEGSAHNPFQLAQQPRAQAKMVSFAESSGVFPGVEEDQELDAQSEMMEEAPTKPTSSLVQKFFYSQKPEKPVMPQQDTIPDDLLHKQVEELEEQVKRLNDERAKIAQQRRQVEDARARLEQDKTAFEKRKAEELAQVAAMKMEELRKLQRDRRVLEKQSRALLRLPTKREKEEIQALEAVLEKERQNGRGKDARHKLTVDRLRRQILELQEKNSELREQVQHLESQRLQQWGGDQGTCSPVKRSMPTPDSAPSPVHDKQCIGSSKPVDDSGPAWTSAGDGQAAGPRGWEAGYHAGCNHPASRPDSGSHRVQAAKAGTVHKSDDLENSESEFEDGGHVRAEELDAGAILMHSLPAVRVSVHKPHQPAVQPLGREQRLSEHGSLPAIAATSSHRLSLEEGVQVPALLAESQPAAAHPDAACSALAEAAVCDVMNKASNALNRFNQLRESLLHHGGLQQKLASRLNSLQGTPAGEPGLAPAEPAPPVSAASHSGGAGDAAPAGSGGPAFDDLRRLGRMLTAGSTVSAGPPHAGLTVQPQLAHQQPGAAAAAASSSTSSIPQHAAVPGGVTMTATSNEPCAPQDAVVSERLYTDGRVEHAYASGMRVQKFPNGSQKQHWPDGRCATRFGNGDIKKAFPDGRVEYYYDAVGCWHVTHAHNVEVLYFPSGQIEAHHPGGVKEIVFPDGNVKKVLPDGRELTITSLHLSKEIQLPQPELVC